MCTYNSPNKKVTKNKCKKYLYSYENFESDTIIKLLSKRSLFLFLCKFKVVHPRKLDLRQT